MFVWKKLYPLFCGLILVGSIAVAVSVIKALGYHITYSATASMPRGFYLIVPIKKINRYDIVEFIPPLLGLTFLHNQRLVPQSGLLLKYVFAIPGDNVCVRNDAIWVNDRKIGKVYRMIEGRLLPQTKICGKLEDGQYLLLSNKRPRSFDGRYFGIVAARNILGRAIPVLLTDS